MTAFDDALAALHLNSDLSEAATYRVGGAGDGVSVRVIRGAPETIEAAFGAQIIAPAIRVHIRAGDLAARPLDGDTITIGATVLVVRHAQLDAERLTWECSCDG